VGRREEAHSRGTSIRTLNAQQNNVYVCAFCLVPLHMPLVQNLICLMLLMGG
jgi:hypothetical protein